MNKEILDVRFEIASLLEKREEKRDFTYNVTPMKIGVSSEK